MGASLRRVRVALPETRIALLAVALLAASACAGTGLVDDCVGSDAFQARCNPALARAEWSRELDRARRARSDGNVARAEAAYRVAAESSESPLLGPAPRITTWTELGELYQEWGRAEDAERAFVRASALPAESSPLVAWSTVSPLAEAARLRAARGDDGSAREAWRLALHRSIRFLRAFPDEPTARSTLRRVAGDYVSHLRATGREDDAEQVTRRASQELESARKAVGAPGPGAAGGAPADAGVTGIGDGLRPRDS